MASHWQFLSPAHSMKVLCEVQETEQLSLAIMQAPALEPHVAGVSSLQVLPHVPATAFHWQLVSASQATLLLP